MIYYRLDWKNNNDNEPKCYYLELSEKRFQNKMIEIYNDGSIKYATRDFEEGTFLIDEPYPEISDVNGADPDIVLYEITKDDFYNVWNRYVKE